MMEECCQWCFPCRLHCRKTQLHTNCCYCKTNTMQLLSVMYMHARMLNITRHKFLSPVSLQMKNLLVIRFSSFSFDAVYLAIAISSSISAICPGHPHPEDGQSIWPKHQKILSYCKNTCQILCTCMQECNINVMYYHPAYQHPLYTFPLRHSMPIMAKKQYTTISKRAMLASLGRRAIEVVVMSRNLRLSLNTLNHVFNSQ